MVGLTYTEVLDRLIGGSDLLIDDAQEVMASVLAGDLTPGQIGGLLVALRAKQPTVDDLYVAVGNGNIGPKDVVHAVYPELKGAAHAPRVLPTLPPRAPRANTAGADGGSVPTTERCCT